MSKRMQVLLDPAEARQMQRVARTHGMTLSEWVRRTLRAACGRAPGADPSRKIARLRASLRHGFPAPDIDQMLAEIDRGRESDPKP